MEENCDIDFSMTSEEVDSTASEEAKIVQTAPVQGSKPEQYIQAAGE